MLCAWIQVGDHHVDSLNLLVLGRDGAHFVRNLVSFHRHVLSLNVRDVDKDVLSSVWRPYESMTLRPGEVFTHPFKYRTWFSSHCRWVCASAFSRQWARQLSGLWWFPLLLPNPAALPQEGKGELQGSARRSEGQWGDCRQRGVRVWHRDLLESGFSFALFLGFLQQFAKKEKEEGSHLLHGTSVGEGEEAFQRRALTGEGVEQTCKSADQLSGQHVPVL